MTNSKDNQDKSSDFIMFGIVEVGALMLGAHWGACPAVGLGLLIWGLMAFTYKMVKVLQDK